MSREGTAIEVDGVVRTYRARRGPEVRALDGVTLQIAWGEMLGLLGPNGAGKTTLVRILATLLRPDAGRVLVAGTDVDSDPAAVRRLVGYAPQEAGLDVYSTGRQNLELLGHLHHLPRREVALRAAELLERFSLGEAAARPLTTFSGGMRKRLELASALIHRPRVLLLDEPTLGLDPEGRAELWRLIGEVRGEGVAILLTTHYLEEADRLADRVAILHRGALAAEGTPAALKASVGDAHASLDDVFLNYAGRRLADADAPAAVMGGRR
jgi:ABC-2 type transport system ATP-binding protein